MCEYKFFSKILSRLTKKKKKKQSMYGIYEYLSRIRRTIDCSGRHKKENEIHSKKCCAFIAWVVLQAQYFSFKYEFFLSHILDNNNDKALRVVFSER